jgi:spoIIIJ-associated protein
MSSRERRIVHLALKDIPGVRTESVGMGEERQVVIHPAESKASC